MFSPKKINKYSRFILFVMGLLFLSAMTVGTSLLMLKGSTTAANVAPEEGAQTAQVVETELSEASLAEGVEVAGLTICSTLAGCISRPYFSDSVDN